MTSTTSADRSTPLLPNRRRRRTPTLLQMEAVECGAAALGIMLGYYGRIVPLAELRQVCGVSRDGSKATNMLIAAQQYGLEAKGFKVSELLSLQELELPFVVFWNFNHFLVIEGFSKDRVYLNDPATGPRTVDLVEFDTAFTGVVLTFKPGQAFQKGGKPPDLMRSLGDRLRSSRGVLVYCIFVGFLLVIPNIATPVFTQIFIDEVLVSDRGDWLRPLLLSMVVMAIVEGILTLIQLRFLRRMNIKLSMGMSSQFIWHILRLPVSFYEQRFAGEISSRIHLNDRLAQVLSGELATTAISAVMVVFYMLVMVQYNALLSGIGIAAVALNLIALQLVSRWRVDANLGLIQEQGKVSGVAISGLQSMETLKASGLESDFFARWSGAICQSHQCPTADGDKRSTAESGSKSAFVYHHALSLNDWRLASHGRQYDHWYVSGLSELNAQLHRSCRPACQSWQSTPDSRWRCESAG
jgi:ATP-binding cassette, subfamily C, bacterial